MAVSKEQRIIGHVYRMINIGDDSQRELFIYVKKHPIYEAGLFKLIGDRHNNDYGLSWFNLEPMGNVDINGIVSY